MITLSYVRPPCIINSSAATGNCATASMPVGPCWRCGTSIREPKPTSCTFIACGGPPSDWDIHQYADSVIAARGIGTLPGKGGHPPTMAPVGRQSGEAKLVAHSSCYRLLLGVINAARADPERAAKFEHDHPSQRFTRQQAAAGEPEPPVAVQRGYGERQRRVTFTPSEQAAKLAEEAGAPRLCDLNLRGAHIPLINEEMLAEFAAGLEMASPQGGGGGTVGGAAGTSTSGGTATQVSPPTVQTKSHKAKPQMVDYKIAPSILSADFARLGEEVENVLD